MINFIHFIKYPRILNGSLVFSVSISNDLRTEFLEPTNPIQINAAVLIHNRQSKPIKLDNVLIYAYSRDGYKVIDLPLSVAGLSPSDTFSLLIYTKNSSIKPNLKDVLHLQHPIPLQSLPSSLNQAQYLQQRSFTVNTQQLHIVEHTSFDLDKKLWDNLSKSLKILELGTGTGIVSITLATLLSQMSKQSHTITATDLNSAIPLLRSNTKRNAHLYKNIEIQPKELSWGSNSSLESVEYDIIIAADITYNMSSFQLLRNTLSNLFTANPLTKLILAHKYRDYQEDTFWDHASQINLKSTHLKSIGCGRRGYETEIWEFKRM
ncbi:hypothetical protein E3P86_03735 [Wallemia ichthyophaga]|uniref:Methyltransferase-domain-containing protein n=1 Tax=Wallemia ichthyophaga TaxID=245174 RepID=A0A4T0IM21_WALIC|nr:hypothetical protein E3P86_03735 [Wallemia ichthyophaga]